MVILELECNFETKKKRNFRMKIKFKNCSSYNSNLILWNNPGYSQSIKHERNVDTISRMKILELE